MNFSPDRRADKTAASSRVLLLLLISPSRYQVTPSPESKFPLGPAAAVGSFSHESDFIARDPLTLTDFLILYSLWCARGRPAGHRADRPKKHTEQIYNVL
jgi:hypothetical protein